MKAIKWFGVGAASALGIGAALVGAAFGVGAAVERGRRISQQRQASGESPAPFRRAAEPMVGKGRGLH